MALIFQKVSRNLFISKLLNRTFKMSAQLRSEKVVEELKDKNPYYNKYAEKIAALQKTSPDEFLSRIDNANRKLEKKVKKSMEKDRDYSELLQPKDSKPSSSSSDIPNKKLEDLMKIELVKDKTVDEIKQIWLEYHKNKDVLVATLTNTQYEEIMKKSRSYPIFILPLPRTQGYEFFVLQFAANTVHFTPLICYQVHKENSPECLNMVHYTEFKDQDIILMRGEYDAKVLNSQEAQCLANQLQLYYGQNTDSKLKLLELFTKKPDSFKHMDLIKELENLSITTL